MHRERKSLGLDVVKRLSLAGVGLAAVVLFPSLSCAEGVPGEVEGGDGDPLVATVGGTELRQHELEEQAAQQLKQVELQKLQCETKADQQRQEVLEATVERLVRERLLDLEAQRREVPEEELRNEVKNSVGEISQEQVDEWYEKNKARVRQPKENVEGQIRALLGRERQQKVENSFFEELKDRFEVAYLLEPLRVEVAAEGFPALGSEEAPVTIVEFSDFECPYCKRLLPTLQQVREQYGDDVRIVFRQYPLANHANAQKAAEASLCARDQGKFWELHDLMFEEQRSLKVDDLKEKAARLELDTDAFNECLDSGSHAAAVREDFAAGSRAGVTGTPAMFINGRHLSGAVPFETVSKLVSEELRRSRQE